MKRLASSTAILLGFALIGLDMGSRMDEVSAAVAGEHNYFDALSRRADAWKSYSLRSSAQLGTARNGGFASGNDTRWITYNPETDTDRNRQDAAKVVIPAFFQTTTLAQAVGAGDTVLTLVEAYRPLFPRGRVIKVDREVMTVTGWLTDTTVSVQRGAYNSSAAPHAAGVPLSHSNNSVRATIRVPLGTEDGHNYFFTWDSYWTDSYVGAGNFNHKAFQFSSGGRDGDTIWLEPDASYGDTRAPCYNPAAHIAAYRVRSYNLPGGVLNWMLTDGNKLGPSVRNEQPLDQVAHFCIKPNQWVRFFVHIRQRANDYDYLDMWVADETRDPVQVTNNIPISVRPTGLTPNSIAKWWVEFNSSVDAYMRVDNRDLVNYVRNFVALRDAADMRSLLIRPVPGATAVDGPMAPRNVRILPAPSE